MNSNLIPRIVRIDLDYIVKFGRKLLTHLLLFLKTFLFSFFGAKWITTDP
jgi:hypothetical protein